MTDGVERSNNEDFKGIHSRNYQRVFSLCLCKTGSEIRAQGLAKEAFLPLFGMLDALRKDLSMGF
jgi:DNA-directed RNA polymerase specialized sigma24 family protein